MEQSQATEPPKAKKRVNRMALGKFEQWILPRMAARLPDWVTPDKLTIVGLLASLGIGLGYLLTHLSLNWIWLAASMYVLNWWGDSLDGTLARVRKIQREKYGFYVDHQSDAISTLLIFAGLGFSPLMELSIAMALIIGYYLLMIHVNLVTIVRDVFKISFGMFGPTEGRILMILASVIVWAFGNPLIPFGIIDLKLFDAIGIGGAGIMLLVYAYSGLVERGKLAKMDPPRKRGDA